MNDEDTREQLLKRLRGLYSKYLGEKVTKPSLRTVKKEFFAQDHLVELLLIVCLLVELANKEGIELDKNILRGLSREEIEKRIGGLTSFVEMNKSKAAEETAPIDETLGYLAEGSSRKYLLSYLKKEINWVVVSIMSASYASSMVLMRSAFELIIGIASKSTGSMSSTIDSIAFLSDEEKNRVKKLWYRLCAWGHPYGKWIKEICPIYANHEPLYHPKLCKLCLQELGGNSRSLCYGYNG